MAEPVSVILVVIDTLRYDFVGANGNRWIATPHLDALARRGATFDRCYAGSFPTIPCRWELITGRAHPDGLPFHPWRPLEWNVPTIPDLLRQAGYVTMLLCDTPHLINHGYGFDRPFHAWDLIRGQEVDRCSTEPLTVADLPAPPDRHWRPSPQPAPRAAADAGEIHAIPFPHRQYLRNRRARHPVVEDDYLPARLFTAAGRWLERNRDHPRFFLWIDCFDPHEPWDPPLADRRRYDPMEGGVRPVVPPQGPPVALTAEAQRWVSLYAGEVTLVDRWLGSLLGKLEWLGLADRTAVIVMSDHGTLAGQHGRFGKGYPLYEPIAHQALFVRLPGDEAAGTRVPALAQPVDVARTVLELTAAQPPATMPLDGQSLLPLLRRPDGQSPGRREVVLSGGVPPAGSRRPSGSAIVPPISVNDGGWTLIADPDRDRWQLFDNAEDPGQQVNRLHSHAAVALRLHAAMVAELQARGASAAVLRAYAEACPGGPSPDVLEAVEEEARRRPRYEQFQNHYFL